MSYTYNDESREAESATETDNIFKGMWDRCDDSGPIYSVFSHFGDACMLVVV